MEEVAILFVSEEDLMQRNVRLQMVGMLAVGALLGYLAASGKPNPFATASTTRQAQEEKAARADKPEGGEKPACCCDGDRKSVV